jgi:endonuclease III
MSRSIKPASCRAKSIAEAAEILEILAATYPEAKCELDFANSLQLLVAVILSAQCTDRRVNMVTPALFRRYPDAAAFASSQPAELEELIRSTGFYRNKAKNIRLCCQQLVERFQGRVPDTMEELISLSGVGRKTANVILNVAYGKNEGVCVDTHVLRLSERLGFSRNSTPEDVERDLMALFPRQKWGDATMFLIWHGRRRCFARGPDCPNCELNHLCPSRKIFSSSSKK